MKITRLRIINFLGIKEFVADKLGKINEITGDNDVGKTTILDAIQEVFKSSGVDPTLVHNDADEAEIMIEIDGRYLAERHITHDENDVVVQENKIPIKKPATFLAELLGAYNFRPVDFFLAKPKERRDMFCPRSISSYQKMRSRKSWVMTVKCLIGRN
jgi:predicted ATP-dependent endonuclease of OLD family